MLRLCIIIIHVEGSVTKHQEFMNLVHLPIHVHVTLFTQFSIALAD